MTVLIPGRLPLRKENDMSQSYLIKCEGPRCNGGRSAKDREDLGPRPSMSEDQRNELTKFLRSATSNELTYTQHNRVGVGRGGRAIYACAVCGFERVYGNTFWGA